MAEQGPSAADAKQALNMLETMKSKLGGVLQQIGGAKRNLRNAESHAERLTRNPTRNVVPKSAESHAESARLSVAAKSLNNII